MQPTFKNILLRLPRDLWRDLQAEARRNCRSLTAEIVFRLTNLGKK